jgi:hypothetical protein
MMVESATSWASEMNSRQKAFMKELITPSKKQKVSPDACPFRDSDQRQIMSLTHALVAASIHVARGRGVIWAK